MLIALLFGISDSIVDVDIHWLVILEEVLLGVLDDAVGAEWHETVEVAAEVS